MSDQRQGGIAWTDETWNPIRGCSRVSEGCRNCYAETMAARFSDPGQPYHGLAQRTPKGPRWTGKVQLFEDKLAEPLRWARPRKIFVNSMSDLFHESLNDYEIAAVFGVMAHCPQHVFQVLTKRSDRMVRWFGWIDMYARARQSLRRETVTGWDICNEAARAFLPDVLFPDALIQWPLPNVWLGVSVENQDAVKRVDYLLRCPAVVRWLSIEPIVGPVDLLPAVGLAPWSNFQKCDRPGIKCGYCWSCAMRNSRFRGWNGNGLDWIVVGGESGPNSRVFNLAWAQQLRAQVRGTGIGFFMKQLGRLTRMEDAEIRTFTKAESANMDNFPDNLRVRQWPMAWDSVGGFE